MVYLISDLHGDKTAKGLQEYLNIATDSDLLIILGDICLQFEDTEENREFTECFLSSKKNIAFIDGNHENFKYLNTFPKESWCGGEVRRLSKHIVYLQRGNVYELGGKTFFTFGGCKSSDKWKTQGLWNPEEAATEEQYQLALENLKKHNHVVDYILTHKYEGNAQHPRLDKYLFDLVQYIEREVSYKKWYFGHAHVERLVDEKHVCVYHNLWTL